MKKSYFVLTGFFILLLWAAIKLGEGVQTSYAQTAVLAAPAAQGEPEDGANIGDLLDTLKPDVLDFSHFLELLFPDNISRASNDIDLDVKIPDFGFSMAFAGSANSSDPAEDPTIALKGQVAFTAGEQIIFTMQVGEPIPLPLTLVFKHRLDEGLLKLELISGKFGPFSLPESLLSKTESFVDDLCAGLINGLASNMTVEDVHFEDGAITLVMQRH
ncbi:MAG: hypothetical protein KDE56_04555 [Anaerolineales bacterium]|nr:hypothetical protein [Anaerolineales bacterium]